MGSGFSTNKFLGKIFNRESISSQEPPPIVDLLSVQCSWCFGIMEVNRDCDIKNMECTYCGKKKLVPWNAEDNNSDTKIPPDDDEELICLSCWSINSPGASFCASCGSPSKLTDSTGLIKLSQYKPKYHSTYEKVRSLYLQLAELEGLRRRVIYEYKSTGESDVSLAKAKLSSLYAYEIELIREFAIPFSVYEIIAFMRLASSNFNYELLANKSIVVDHESFMEMNCNVIGVGYYLNKKLIDAYRDAQLLHSNHPQFEIVESIKAEHDRKMKEYAISFIDN